jgi:hypothetical protein
MAGGADGKLNAETQRGKPATEQDRQTEKWGTERGREFPFFCPPFFCRYVFRYALPPSDTLLNPLLATPLSTLNPQPSATWITSLTCSINLSFGFGMNPSRALDAFSFLIYKPIFTINPCGQSL